MNNKTITYLFGFLLVTSVQVFGQDEGIADSARTLIQSKNLSDDQKLESYNWLSSYSSSPLERIEYGEKLLALASRYNDQEYLYHANFNLGVAYRLIGKLDTGLEYLFESANIASKDKDLRELLPDVYTEISTCYTQNGDSRNALLYGSKSIDILRGSDNRKVLALTLLNYGYDYYLIEEYDSAMAYYNESEPILRDIDLAIGLAYIRGNRALVYWKQGNVDIAKNDLFSAIDMLKPFGDTYGMSDYYNQLGRIFYEEGSYDQAIEYTTRSFEMASTEDYKEQARDAAELLSKLYKKQNSFEQAYTYQTEYFKYRDSIQNLATTQRLANLRIEFEVGRKQAQVDRLLEQKQSNRTIMIVGAISLLAVILLVIIIYSSLKSKNKLSEQLEKQNGNLQQANQTKDRFFSIISHDLRGPVNALSGLVGVVKFYVNEGKTEQLDELTLRMEEATSKLVKLLDSLLSWSMQQQGHFPYLPERLSVKGMFEDVTEMFENSAISKKIELTYDIDNDVYLHADRNTTSTILRNLINNAIKFTSEGGKVQVRGTENSGYGVIEVTDNGVGIPEEKKAKLFELNENISTRGTAGESGLGLGLQLVCEFVELNKGKISTESEVGKGTTFSVKLPLAKS